MSYPATHDRQDDNRSVQFRRVLLAAVIAAAGCGGGDGPPGADKPSPEPAPPAQPRAALAARAAAAQDLVTVSSYTLTTGGDDRTVVLVRAEDRSWRVDIEGGALGGTADVAIAANGDGLFHCAMPSAGLAEGACVRVPALAPRSDPRVQHVFTDWLDVLTDRAAALAVSDTTAPADDTPGRCFGVEPTAASLVAPVDAGTYCYAEDGTLTAAWLDLGTLRLASTSDVAPPTVDLPGPVVDGDPLPTAPPPSPTAPATPSPSPLVS